MGKKTKEMYNGIFDTLRTQNVEFLAEALYQNEKITRVLDGTEISDTDFRFAAEMLWESRKFSLDVNVSKPNLVNITAAKKLLVYAELREDQAETIKKCMEDNVIFYDKLIRFRDRLESILDTVGLSRTQLAEQLKTLQGQERNFVEENTTKIQSAPGSKFIPGLHQHESTNDHTKTVQSSINPGLSYLGACVQKEEVSCFEHQPRKA